ncbi:tetratricopeptide repeat protein [Leptolyngbya sp. FACHB-541]|uniref:tetratricopeptide repeat protein n=1 Tax=Leptolyngbya sp. FACHB-541 TaxID=2692810 RepID=UPI001683A0DF|nr:tetratricopeptide repeat protein [Leptolyngbya sp. FACHB-541]MBD1999977.1 tetratricopeptide repeat protein [Leptolyngbya sp. FACHB-541]
MKKRHWLELVESLSLVGLGVGSVVSLMSKQVLFASTPLSVLVLLNLINRRRFEDQSEQNTAIALSKLDRRVSKHIELLNQQMMSLPTPEAIGSLKKTVTRNNREILDKLASEVAEIRQEIQDRLDPIEQQGIQPLRQEIYQIHEQYAQLSDTLAGVTNYLQKASPANRMEEVEGAIAQFKTELVQIRVNLQNLTNLTKPSIVSLRDQVSHLNRQFQKLPPPVDSTSLKQEVAELIKMVSTLVPKRDWSVLMAEMKEMQQQQEALKQSLSAVEATALNLRRQVEKPIQIADPTATLELRYPPPFTPPAQAEDPAATLELSYNPLFDSLPRFDQTVYNNSVDDPAATLELGYIPPDPTSDLEESLARIGPSMNGLMPSLTFSDLFSEAQVAMTAYLNGLQNSDLASSELYMQAEGAMTAYLSSIQEQFASLQQFTQTLAEQHKQLQEQVSHLPPAEDAEMMRHHLEDLTVGLAALKNNSKSFQTRVEATLHQELEGVNRHLQALPTGLQYELIFDLKSHQSGMNGKSVSKSRAILEEALTQTQERLILVWQWSAQSGLDDGLMQKLETLLSQKRQLDVGWCHVADRNEVQFLSSINQQWSIDPIQRGAIQETLHKLLQLKRNYPDYFRFKVLGARENFLVSDQSFALLGVDESLTTTTVLSNLELKLRTTDPEVIQKLTESFDSPTLDPEDVAAHWNRAVTRYRLGDKAGAIADFDSLIALTPRDAAAYNGRALVRYDQGNKSGALADLSEAIVLDPRYLAAYCNRGFIRVEMGDPYGAIADYSLAIQIQPNPIVYFYRGMACQKLGNPQAAVADYSEAIALSPNNAIVHYYRGIAYQRLGNRGGAIADLEIAAKLFTERGSKANAQKALSNIAKLRQAPTSSPVRTTAINHSMVPEALKR